MNPLERIERNSYQTILYGVKDGVARITMNRPDSLNSLNARMLGELNDVFARINDDPESRCVVKDRAGA